MKNAHTGGWVVGRLEGVPFVRYPGCQGLPFGSLCSMRLVFMKCFGLNAPYVSGSETIRIFAYACQITTSDICHDHSIDVKTRSLRSSDMMNLEAKEYVRRG